MMSRFALPLLFAATAAHAAITGILVDELGKPVAGATIRAYAPDASPVATNRPVAGAAESAENGAFKVDVKAPAVDLVVEAAGQQPQIAFAADGDELNVVVLHPRPGRKVRLVADGKPVANATLFAGPFTAHSDGAGMLELPYVMTRLAVVHPDFAPTETFGVLDFGEPTDVVLSRGVAIHGRVLAADGQPVAGATITIGSWPFGQSAADGTFTIAHAPANWRTIVARDATRAGMVTNVRGASVDIKLQPAGFIAGTAAPGARVSIARPGEVGESVIADAQGNFASPSLVPGDYDVRTLRRGYATGPNHVLVTAGKRVTSAGSVRPLAIIRGRVVDDDKKPVAGAFVGYGYPQLQQGLVMTGANGEFAIRRNDGPTSNGVYVVKSGYAMGISGPDSGKNDITITLPGGFPLQVRVNDRQRKPVAQALVTIVSGGPEDFRSQPIEIACEQPLVAECHRTADNGTINLHAAAGQYSARVTGSSLVPKIVPPEAMTAQSSPLTIEVDRGVEVSGRVMYGDGSPVTDAMISVRPFGVAGMVRTEPDGSFRLRNVMSGKVSLIAQTMSSQLASAPVEIEAPARGVSITIPTPARIEGRVTDKETGQPMTDFQIGYSFHEGRSGPVPMPQVVHSDDGSYVLDRVAVGSLDLQFAAAGHARGTISALTTEEGKTVRGANIQLDKGGSVRGRVTASGEPVSGAFVQLADTRSMSSNMRGANMATTDENGEYLLDGVTEGDRTIDIFKEGFTRKRKNVEVARGKEARLDIELDRGVELHGRVADKNGQALSGVRISGYPIGGGMSLRPATTDASGAFTLTTLSEGRYNLTAMKEGYVEAHTSDVVVPATAPVTITLDPGGTITGRVVGLTPAELAAAEVTVNGGGSYTHTPVNSDGAFNVRGVPDGHLTVAAFVRGGTRPRQSVPQSVDVVNGTAPSVQIDFNQGITVSGRVTRNGVPLSSGTVSFNGRGASIVNDGTYQVEGLTAGDYTVAVFAQSGTLYRAKYNVQSNSTYDIQIQGTSVRGRVIDASTGAPVSDVVVVTTPTRDNPASRQTMSDTEGYFTLDSMADGTYQLRAMRDRYAPGSQTVTVNSGSAPEIEIRLDSAQATAFRVTDAQTGAPLDAMVVVMDGRKMVTQSRGVRDDDGDVRVYVGPGQYLARVTARGYASQSVNFSVPGPEVRVMLMLPGRMLLVASRPTRVLVRQVSTPMAGVGGTVRGGIVYTATPSGTLVDNLSPGNYYVDVMGTSGAVVLKSIPAMVTSAQTSTVNVE